MHLFYFGILKSLKPRKIHSATQIDHSTPQSGSLYDDRTGCHWLRFRRGLSPRSRRLTDSHCLGRPEPGNTWPRAISGDREHGGIFNTGMR